MLANGWARRWGPRLGCSSARGTARAWVRRWARNSVRACVVAVVRCFVRPSRVAALSRRQRSFWGVPRRRRRDAIDAKPTEHALDAIDTSRHRRGRTVGGRLPKKQGTPARTSARKWDRRSARRRAPARGATWAPVTASASATSRARTWGRSCAGVMFRGGRSRCGVSRRRRRDAVDAVDAEGSQKNEGRRH